MQVSVLDLSLKCKTIASLVQVNVGVLKTLDLHTQSWKGFGCLAFPREPALKPCGPTPSSLRQRPAQRAPQELPVPEIASGDPWTEKGARLELKAVHTHKVFCRSAS